MVPFLYLGGKHSLRRYILPILLPQIEHADEYREPFVGSGAIGLSVMSRHARLPVWINDRDAAIACFWYAAKHAHCDLIERVRRYVPTVEDFRAFREPLTGAPPQLLCDITQVGFQQIVVGYTSWAGWRGGPHGGYAQRNVKVGIRWKPDLIVRKLRVTQHRLSRTDARITALDFAKLIDDTSHRAALYLDPPYRGLGNFRYGFLPDDHVRLAEMLRVTDHAWVLSYDDHPETRKLFSWAKIVNIAERELVITKN